MMRKIRIALFYAVLTVVGLFMLLPFLWSLSTSLKPDDEIISLPITWLPSSITFEHYWAAFTTVPFARHFANSMVLAVGGVVTNLVLGSLAGYAFARLPFRGSRALFRLLLASMMVPAVVTLVPSFLIVKNLPLAGGNDLAGQGGFGLLNTYWAILLPGAVGAFAVFMMRQFFLALPKDLGEAARVDGCPEFRIFWRIYLPLCRPALATLAVFTFVAGWNGFLWPLIVLNDPDMSTIQMSLAAFSFNKQTDYGPLMAGSIVAMLPTLLLFAFGQRYLTRGLAFTGSGIQ
ncbi:multiple sugar transport system permease protein [Nonomuraea solani]|uniref:Multiple sugar transport system permease protein n=1 Tax=Nonomuraea solani TaxID=1144553 RepID=A0A1H6E4T3_9ACTN|nr:carbohydrate ABC transporter permease [Nonomuraea solani]SEG92006.1 multiple sugar transport system permease protein [Nonomuraea solani]